MEALTVVLGVAVLAALVLGTFLLAGRFQTVESRLREQSEIQEASRQRLDELGNRVSGGLQAMTEAMGSSQDTMKRVGERLGEISESTRQMLEIGRDISSLQDILRPPKLRGSIGELLLERLLAQILPSANYKTQHRFRSGEQVDAVIELGTGLVPVDSKFPMEAFHGLLSAQSDEERSSLRRQFVRDVKRHIDAVAKYILPDEGTFPFAMMYIPAENIYYETIVRDETLNGAGLADYALERQVIPVSPNSFYAYLQAIVLGLKGMRVEEHAREIIDRLDRLNNDFGRFRQEFEVLGGHIGRAKGKYDELEKSVGRLGDRLALPLEGPQPELPPASPSTNEGG